MEFYYMDFIMDLSEKPYVKPNNRVINRKIFYSSLTSDRNII